MEKITEHKNMFSFYSTKKEVYEKFQSDQKMDADRAMYYLCGVFVCIAVFGFYREIFIVLLGAMFAKGYFSAFSDMSNRNFLMHMIDWIEAKQAEKEQ